MRKHQIVLTITAPNRMSGNEVKEMVQRLVDLGKEDAAQTLNNGESQLDEAKDALSLRIKYSKQEV